MHQDTIGTVMITQEEINAKAAEIGQQIEKDFAGGSSPYRYFARRCAVDGGYHEECEP